MQKSPKAKKTRIERACIYVLPDTHKRLNKLKAALSYEVGRFTPLDEAVNALLDHYDATAQLKTTDHSSN